MGLGLLAARSGTGVSSAGQRAPTLELGLAGSPRHLSILIKNKKCGYKDSLVKFRIFPSHYFESALVGFSNKAKGAAQNVYVDAFFRPP